MNPSAFELEQIELEIAKDSSTDDALVNAIEELKNLSIDISKVFIFQGQRILAKDKNVTEAEANKTIEHFEELKRQFNCIEGLEKITINGANGRVDITHINDYYLTIITSKEADEETVNNITQVFAPTIFRIIQNVRSQEARHTPETIKQTPTLEPEEAIVINASPIVKDSKPLEPLESLETSFIEQGFSEFTVDDTSGLGIISGSSDSVQLDAITVGRWSELYGENKIHTVIIKKASTGDSIECKYEVSKDSKLKRRSLILVPSSIQRKLQVRKGEVVLIKPIIQQESSKKSAEDKSPSKNVADAKPEQIIISESHFLPNSPICQLIVTDLSGLVSLRGSNVVRFDKALVYRWKEFYDEQKIEEVTISDTVFGKSEKCKFKIEMDPKFMGKGLIQIPKSLQKAIEVKVGSLVIVKPVPINP